MDTDTHSVNRVRELLREGDAAREAISRIEAASEDVSDDTVELYMDYAIEYLRQLEAKTGAHRRNIESSFTQEEYERLYGPMGPESAL